MQLLAKVSRPVFPYVYGRTRLFEQLDHHLTRGAIWLCGPPGAGKTTAAASYLERRGNPVLWLQVDAGDADPASFFYYLGLAARNAGLSEGARLPVLTPEYLPDLVGFARRFARALCAHMPLPFAFVLDNYQELPEGAPLQTAVAAVLEELAVGVRVVLISRTEPPPNFAHLRASRRLGKIGWSDLRLTSDEAAQIIAMTHQASGSEVATLFDRCGGWAAGLILQLEHGSTPADDTPTTREALFDYFASELFDRADPAERHLLLRTAFLPWISLGMAEAVTGASTAGKLLAGLRRRNFFTQLRPGPEPTYEYHALFREFLTARVSETYTASEQLRLAHKSAALLAQADQSGAAIRLYLSAGDPDAAAQLILKEARALAPQGRFQTLESWIAALPKAVVEDDPELLYWQGLCRQTTDPAAAKDLLAKSFEGFRAAGDAIGQIRAATSIAQIHFLVRDARDWLDPWIDALERLLKHAPSLPDPAVELSACAALMHAMLNRAPERARVAPLARRVKELAELVTDPILRFSAETSLLAFYDYSGAARDAAPLMAALRDRMTTPGLSAVNICAATALIGPLYASMLSDRASADSLIENAIILARTEGLITAQHVLQLTGANACLHFGDPVGARKYITEYEKISDKPGLLDRWAYYYGMRTGIAILECATDEALRNIELCEQHPFSANGWMITLNIGLTRAYVECVAGRYEKAIQVALRVRAHVAPLSPEGTQYDAGIPQAYALLMLGRRDEADAVLRDRLAVWAREGYVTTPYWQPLMMSRLFAFALERGIEAPYVQHLIQLRRLPSPDQGAPAWPWPVRIHAFGRFEVHLDGEPLRLGRKAPKRLLQLLKALVAFGGADVPEQRLADALWPDHDGDQAHELLASSLHRLRRLLGDPKAILVSAGRVSLNAERVWVDVWAFERLSDAPDAGDAACRLYRGSLLADEPDAPWASEPRERLARRFVRLLSSEAARLEDGKAYDEALTLYDRALEVEPRGEGLYLALMRAYHRKGLRAEALATYHRLREALAGADAKPSAAALALHRAIQAA